MYPLTKEQLQETHANLTLLYSSTDDQSLRDQFAETLRSINYMISKGKYRDESK